MLISVVREASGMCRPLCREIACGSLFLAQQVNGGAQCFVQEMPPTSLVLLEHSLPSREEARAELSYPGS